MMYYVYLLLSEIDGNFYTGSTIDLRRRIEEHNNGSVVSTAKRRPLKLIYYEACLSEANARTREKYLKSGMGQKIFKKSSQIIFSRFVIG
ncbi:MAG: GIY-YIG nuclease family protein [Eubacteriaceae bacterium]